MESIKQFVPHFSDVELIQLDNGYYTFEYIGINILVSKDKSKFNASKLIRDIKGDYKKYNYNKWKNQEASRKTLQANPELEEHITGNSQVNGYYLAWVLFYQFIYNISAHNQVTRWLVSREDNWNRSEDYGHVYLVQETRHLGTNIYKIGRTYDTTQRFYSYGAKPKILKTYAVDNMYAAEGYLINEFESKYTRAIRDKNSHGNEYFIIESDDVAIKSFNKAVAQYKLDSQETDYEE